MEVEGGEQGFALVDEVVGGREFRGLVGTLDVGDGRVGVHQRPRGEHDRGGEGGEAGELARSGSRGWGR